MVINDLDIKTTTGTVVKWKGTASEVEIPTEVESRGKQIPVTTVGEYAFLSSNIHTVTLPDTITRLELGAFFDCRYMISINLPDSLESIGPDSFHGCSGLKTITIPDAVTNIGDGAFYYRFSRILQYRPKHCSSPSHLVNFFNPILIA